MTKVDYHYATVLDHYEENDYQQEMSMPEICQEIPQKSYGLKSGVKHATQAKKIVKNGPLKQNLPLNQKQVEKEKRDEVVVLEEVNKAVSGFNLEHEINKVNNPIPLIDLIKKQSLQGSSF